MTSILSPESRESDAMLDGSLSEDKENDSSPTCDDALRLARIEEYRQESLRQEDSLAACLRAITSGLMEFEFR